MGSEDVRNIFEEKSIFLEKYEVGKDSFGERKKNLNSYQRNSKLLTYEPTCLSLMLAPTSDNCRRGFPQLIRSAKLHVEAISKVA